MIKFTSTHIEYEATPNCWLKFSFQDVELLDRINVHFIKNASGNRYPAFYDESGKKHLLHRYLMGLNPGDKEIVDHINMDVWDLRRENLRIVTRSENAHNTDKTHSNCGVRGIRKVGNKYLISFKINGHSYNFTESDFDKAVEIIKVYRKTLGKVPESTLEKIGV